MAKEYVALFLAIIAIMMVEGLVLGGLWYYRRKGVRPAHLAVNLMAGVSLLMAAVVVALGASSPWLLACLALALLMHVADLRIRWSV